MTSLDPQTTTDFWEAYLRAADAGTNLAQVGRTFPVALQQLCSPISGPVSSVPRLAPAAIKFGWDLVLLPAPIAAPAPPRVA
ncbi:MAG TPA: hypothetical protein VKI00_29400 [Mycobacterium sp.]|uniref:hypothetical protein n=1 Tax=Mycobacterium sp. TaxID=1785 RepID=UPI002C94D32E|nr:hypothetical protein [Mycobacterium sp.]HME79630.1 hypothetical protein [Mycobacterium sp.]